MMSVFTIITRDFTSRNKQAVNIRAGAVALVTNVVLNVFMIPNLRHFRRGAGDQHFVLARGAHGHDRVPSRVGIALTEVLIPRIDDVRFV